MHPLTESAMKPIKLAARTEIHGARLPEFFKRTLAQCLRWNRRRRDEALLQAQPDYMLRDIGLGRSEIEAAVRGEARWRR
jgi:uncharacterized protein YjiS (DUF1127 family)